MTEKIDDVLHGEILEPGDKAKQKKREARVRDKFWPTLKKALSQLPFAEDVVAAYYCALDPVTPSRVKGILLAALAYFVMPIDVVPDLIVAIGFGDDIAILSAVIAMMAKHITPEHRAQAKRTLDEMGQ